MAQPHPRRRGEQGASILLAMLVLFVLVVVVYQVFFSSQVEMDRAGLHVSSIRMRHLAEACRLQASSVLLMDVEDQEEGGEGGEGGDGGLGGLGGLGGGGGGGEAGGSLNSAVDVMANTDSFLDEWQNPVTLAPALAEDLVIHIEVVDEDSKINLLGLWAEDEEIRKEWRDVFEKLLDKAFEGSTMDISGFDSSELIEGLDDWVKGDRRLFDRRDPPKLKRTDAEDEQASEVDTDIIENEERNFPLTLGELLMVEGLQPDHLDGFIENDEYYPGLREYLTIWTHLELKAPPPEEDDFADSPLAGLTGEEGDEQGDETTLETAQTAANGTVNANTAPLPVLIALAPEDIPEDFLRKVVEFREKIYELQETLGLDEEEEEDTFRGDDESDAEDAAAEELDEDDPAFYVFQQPSDVFDKIEDQWDLSVFTDESEKDKFTSRLGVTSEVFTIKILIFDEESGRRGSYRTVVWRVDDDEQPRIIPLLPLEEYHDPRRRIDLPDDLAETSADRFEDDLRR